MASFETTMSDAVLTAIAEREGIGKEDLEQPLYDAVSPEALDSLFRNSGGKVTFEYHGYVVTVDSSRQVDIAPAQE
jgi:hypothetical protein